MKRVSRKNNLVAPAGISKPARKPRLPNGFWAAVNAWARAFKEHNGRWPNCEEKRMYFETWFPAAAMLAAKLLDKEEEGKAVWWDKFSKHIQYLDEIVVIAPKRRTQRERAKAKNSVEQKAWRREADVVDDGSRQVTKRVRRKGPSAPPPPATLAPCDMAQDGGPGLLTALPEYQGSFTGPFTLYPPVVHQQDWPQQGGSGVQEALPGYACMVPTPAYGMCCLPFGNAQGSVHAWCDASQGSHCMAAYDSMVMQQYVNTAVQPWSHAPITGYSAYMSSPFAGSLILDPLVQQGSQQDLGSCSSSSSSSSGYGWGQLCMPDCLSFMAGQDGASCVLSSQASDSDLSTCFDYGDVTDLAVPKCFSGSLGGGDDQQGYELMGELLEDLDLPAECIA